MPMIAVIKTGGKQYKVKEKDVITVEKLGKKPGDTVEFKEVLMLAEEDGNKLSLGNPFIKGAKVTAKVLDEKKGDKILVIKFKRKVRYRRKKGHRQWGTKLQIEKIA